jgi:hypothetical protein
MYSFGTPTQGTPGSHYKLCWAHDPSVMSDYNVEIDASADLAGPDLQDFQCTLGMDCSYTLSGYRLASSNKIRVLAAGGECGTPAEAAAWSVATDDLAVASASADSNAYALGVALTGVAGDTYKVCWGHDPQSAEEFNVEIDAGAALTGPLVGERQCTLGVDCQIQLEGHGLESTNAVVILSEGSCGNSSATVDWVATQTWTAVQANASDFFSYDMGKPIYGQAGGGYKLCWASNPRAVNATVKETPAVGPAHQLVNFSLEDFNVEIDPDFGLVGPYRGEFECDLGAMCRVTISGFGLVAQNKLVMVTGGECGDDFGYGQPNSLAPASLGYAAETLSDDGDEAAFRLGTALSAVGDFYKLCWSWQPEPPNFPLNLPNYNVEVDPDFLIQFPSGGGWGRRTSAEAWSGLVGTQHIELVLAPQDTEETKDRL